MKKKKTPDPVKAAALDLPGLSQIQAMGTGFTILDDKVIIICDKSTARRLLCQNRNKGQLPQ